MQLLNLMKVMISLPDKLLYLVQGEYVLLAYANNRNGGFNGYRTNNTRS
jgi:hypothetical protein